ncbi:Eco57I restriction-modification methylase domain-containing protein, partial [Klebsiella pneumoniae]|uniref:Eco57I restriction-modification methylase domain-containing protein n=1 Tax=Klebsiella pneumoniae TaxID=573 RepID=UPI0015F3222B
GFSDVEITEGDFLEWAKVAIQKKNTSFDAIIGNPPFIRYQFLEKDFQENTEAIFKLLDLKFTKHTNAWVPFILSGVSLLIPGGRL